MQYLNELLKVCGVAILCAVTLMVLGRTSASGVGFAIRIGGSILIFGIFITILGSNIESIESLVSLVSGSGASYVSKSFSLMLKALGIALLSKLCADVCRDCGENTLAGGVESVGRVAIFSLCIPVISEIIEYASQVLSMGE